MNGFLSFTTNYLSYTPYPFPHYDDLNADLLGAFWADADSSGMYYDQSGNSVVYYHVYQKTSDTTLPPPSQQRVFDMATRDGQTYISSSFSANWVMVVTWSQVVPWPFNSNQYSSEVNRKNLRNSRTNYVVRSVRRCRQLIYSAELLINTISLCVPGPNTNQLNLLFATKFYIIANNFCFLCHF